MTPDPTPSPTPEQVTAARKFCVENHCEGQRTRGDGAVTSALAALIATREAALRERAEKAERRWEQAGLSPYEHYGEKIAQYAMRASGWPKELDMAHPQWRSFCDGAADAARDLVAAAYKIGQQQSERDLATLRAERERLRHAAHEMCDAVDRAHASWGDAPPTMKDTAHWANCNAPAFVFYGNKLRQALAAVGEGGACAGTVAGGAVVPSPAMTTVRTSKPPACSKPSRRSVGDDYEGDNHE